MKRKVILIIIFFSILGISAGIYKLINDRSPKLGVLKITSTPQASIFIDSGHIGSSPYEEKLSEGEHTLKLVPETSSSPYSSWQGKINIAKNLLTYVNAQLGETDFETVIDILWLEKISSNQSEISVITNPDGATVSIDGQSKGNSPIIINNISQGEHTIAVNSVGFAPRTIKVKTTSGYRLIANLKMALSKTGAQDVIEESSPSSEISENEITPTLQKEIETTITPKKSIPLEPEKPYVLIKDTPTGFLRVRMEPTTSATEAAKINPGEKYPYLDEKNGWYEIEYKKDSKGWISGQYSQLVE